MWDLPVILCQRNIEDGIFIVENFFPKKYFKKIVLFTNYFWAESGSEIKAGIFFRSFPLFLWFFIICRRVLHDFFWICPFPWFSVLYVNFCGTGMGGSLLPVMFECLEAPYTAAAVQHRRIEGEEERMLGGIKGHWIWTWSKSKKTGMQSMAVKLKREWVNTHGLFLFVCKNSMDCLGSRVGFHSFMVKPQFVFLWRFWKGKKRSGFAPPHFVSQLFFDFFSKKKILIKFSF